MFQTPKQQGGAARTTSGAENVMRLDSASARWLLHGLLLCFLLLCTKQTELATGLSQRRTSNREFTVMHGQMTRTLSTVQHGTCALAENSMYPPSTTPLSLL